MPVVADGSQVSIPVRAQFHVKDGLIDELHYGYGNTADDWNSGLDDLIFRTYPELWDDLFGEVTTAEAAAEQARQQAAWLEIALERCSISHCKSPKVPAPTISDSQRMELESQIRARWSQPFGNRYSHWPDCLYDPYSPIDLDPGGGWAYTSYRQPLQPGLPSLWFEAPASMSAEQSEIIVDWIMDAAACDPTATILPPESPARGYLADDESAVFAVTDPRGGVVWMALSGGNVTMELIDELATIAQQYLDAALGTTSND